MEIDLSTMQSSTKGEPTSIIIDDYRAGAEGESMLDYEETWETIRV